MPQVRRVRRWAATTMLLVALASGTAPNGFAEPDDNGDQSAGGALYSDPLLADPLPAPSDDLAGVAPNADSLPPPRATPYPDIILIQTYEARRPDEFFTSSNEGVWFSTPLG